jgi:hypothetical protein
LGNHSGVTVDESPDKPVPEHESPDKPVPEDDIALLTAALDHCWTWYDGHAKRAFQILNYYLVTTALVLTAYTSALKANDFGIAAAVALTGLGITPIAFYVARQELAAADVAVPALTELQRRIAGRLKIGTVEMLKKPPARVGRGRPAMVTGLGLATLLSLGALLYALIH